MKCMHIRPGHEDLSNRIRLNQQLLPIMSDQRSRAFHFLGILSDFAYGLTAEDRFLRTF